MKVVVAAGTGGAGGLERRSPRRPKVVVAAGTGGAGGLERRPPRRPKVVVAMSGGVDSSVAAALLVERGYDVTGVMLKLWSREPSTGGSGCCGVGAADDARRVADLLGIPFYVLNFAERFEDTVVQDFRDTYARGQTPNPCVRCNQWIKFDTLLGRADALGADYLATGHYARLKTGEGRVRLLRGVDRRKDQSYVLWMLSQDELARCLFPLGSMTKPETRALAARLGLRTAAKPDSQEICFVPDGDVGTYLEGHVREAALPGRIVDNEGNDLGAHRGAARYTIGQRKGLGISLGEPVYVTSVNAGSNTVVVGSHRDLEVSNLALQEVSEVGRALGSGDDVLVQHRAHGDAHPARVEMVVEGSLELCYAEPVEAVAPGQSAALYDPRCSDELLGGGVISSTVPAPAVVSL